MEELCVAIYLFDAIIRYVAVYTVRGRDENSTSVERMLKSEGTE